ncbi:MAG: hypothetical protein ACPL5F_11125 [Moorellaceae bacterium]
MERLLCWEACSKYGFTDGALQHYAVEIRRSCWIRDQLDVHVAQKLGSKAFCAARKVLFGQARRVRFKGRNQMDTVEVLLAYECMLLDGHTVRQNADVRWAGGGRLVCA